MQNLPLLRLFENVLITNGILILLLFAAKSGENTHSQLSLFFGPDQGQNRDSQLSLFHGRAAHAGRARRRRFFGVEPEEGAPPSLLG